MSEDALRDEIATRARRVCSRVETACERVGRDPSSVRLVAVIKTFGADVIRAAYEAGLRDFGESYAQDLRDKSAALSDLPDIRWHFVGRIQKNKIRYLAGTAQIVHAVDRLETAKALSDRVERKETFVPDVLISVNLGGEETKSGIGEDDLERTAEAMMDLPGVRLRGLMCLPPWSEEPEGSRPYFARLRKLGEMVRGKMAQPELFHLSMGMSHDLEVAVEEGATMVRVGTDIFGKRRRK